MQNSLDYYAKYCRIVQYTTEEDYGAFTDGNPFKGLKKKMVFLTGPRQVGKTWLAKEIAKLFPKSLYLNYDSMEDRKIIKNESWLRNTSLLIIDELHKMPGWKNHLKGIYDTKKVDTLGRSYTLNYLRTKEGKEVDFCLVDEDKPELMIEVKRSDDSPSKPMLYFKERYGIPGLQLVLHLKHEKSEKDIEIRRGAGYLESLAL